MPSSTTPDFFGYDHTADMIAHFALFNLSEGLARLDDSTSSPPSKSSSASPSSPPSSAPATKPPNNAATSRPAAFIFIALSFGDVLIGDQTQLWEHGTYLLLVLGSYYLYCQPPQFQLMKRERNA